ncbi:MAG: PP2C family protein-serine/threonine phosphatase [Planctomycetota bacterium]
MVNILAVDDDPVFRVFLEKTFAGSDLHVVTEEFPAKAVARAKELQPDLVVLDFEMPGMSGIEVYKALQADPATSELPVWMCSALGDEALMAEAYTLGIADYVVKPISAVAFRAKVERHLKRFTRAINREQLQRHRQSLATAEANVRQMMPDVPIVPGLDIGVAYHPAEEIGGDFYDFFTTQRGTSVFVVGDVTGHGVEAAVIQTMARKLIQVLVRSGESVEQGLHAANVELMQELPKGHFVALTMCEWYPDARTLRFYRLGLPHPLLRQANGTVRVLMSGGTIVGMHPPERFARLVSATDVVLESGDAVFVHSDGAIEAPLPTGIDLGFEGLRKVLRDAVGMGAQGLAEATYDAVKALCGKGTNSDDVTFMVLQAH